MTRGASRREMVRRLWRRGRAAALFLFLVVLLDVSALRSLAVGVAYSSPPLIIDFLSTLRFIYAGAALRAGKWFAAVGGGGGRLRYFGFWLFYPTSLLCARSL